MSLRIPLASPDITAADIDAVVSVLRTPRLSIGPQQEQFEGSLAEYAGASFAIAVSSGTAGLHLCLAALGIGEGDEVILPSFTFVAAAHAVLYQRATPVFSEINARTLNLDPDRLESLITPRTRAILAVHTFGRPVELDPVREIARRHSLALIEDACEALGAEYRGRRVGAFGVAGVFAFYPNKVITAGEGGMVVTSDSALAAVIRALRNQGRGESDAWLEHRLLGYNYRLSELNCALGLAQMQRLESILRRREDVARCYHSRLREIADLTLPELVSPGDRIGWFAYPVRLPPAFGSADCESVCAELRERGIGCSRYFAPLHQQPLFAPYLKARQDLSVTESIAPRMLALPFFTRITEDQITEVAENLAQIVRAHKT